MKTITRKTKSVIPGFGLSFGISIAIMCLVVIIPLCSLVVFSAKLSLTDFIATVTRSRVLASYKVSILTAFLASCVNAVMGLILAWVLVRYDFPFKRVMDGLIELPFALPTAGCGYFPDTPHGQGRMDWRFVCKIWYQCSIYQIWYYHCIDFYRNSICCTKYSACIGKIGAGV